VRGAVTGHLRESRSLHTYWGGEDGRNYTCLEKKVDNMRKKEDGKKREKKESRKRDREGTRAK